MERLHVFWQDLTALQQDSAVFLLLLLPAFLLGVFILRGLRPWPLVRAMLWRYRWTNGLFIMVMALAIAVGVGLLAQERGLRRGSAEAADKFDLIVAAPGSEMTMLMASVFLQPNDVPLLSGKAYAQIAAHPKVEIAAPLAFGDSYKSAPIVGTTADFVQHLAGKLPTGRLFKVPFEAVVGAHVDLKTGDHFTPVHGRPARGTETDHNHDHSSHGGVVEKKQTVPGAKGADARHVAVLKVLEKAAEPHTTHDTTHAHGEKKGTERLTADKAEDHKHDDHAGADTHKTDVLKTEKKTRQDTPQVHPDTHDHAAHGDVSYKVVGKMAPTGSPWDKAILVPVEAVWKVHGLADGHAPSAKPVIGPPFDADYFPGTPAVLVRAKSLWANYALRSVFTTKETMAFFPGAVLARLHGLLGDVRQVMSVLSLLTQILVATSVLAGLAILMRLFARRLALLRAIGAPARFVFALVWSYAGCLIVTGAVVGLGLGLLAVQVISRYVTVQTDLALTASLSWPEFHLIAGFVSFALIISLIPAGLALLRPVLADLRA